MRFADLSVVILTHNEEAAIGAALAALPPDSQRIIYDAESTDATQAIARATGATVISAPWTNFRDARTAALRCSTTAWTFMLDADERPDAELLQAIAEINDAESDGAGIAGYRVHRRNYFCGRAVSGGAWAGESLLRIVRTQDASVAGKDGGTLHEALHVTGAVATLPGCIEHYSYPSIRAYWRKFDRYTSIEARDAAAAGNKISAARLVRAIPAALWQFTVKGGWRDGWRGAFIAGASAAYPFAVAMKSVRSTR